jgi:hypothetical protein
MALEALPPPVAELRGDHGGLVDGLQRMAMVPPVVVHLVDGAAHRGPGRLPASVSSSVARAMAS